jgi:hypothetical protein
MQCREFEERLNEVLDERGSPASDLRLKAHASRCERCESLLAGYQSLMIGLAQSCPPALGRDFDRRVLAEAQALPVIGRAANRAGRSWGTLGAALASAVAMLLAVSVAWYARNSGDGTVARPFVGSGHGPNSLAFGNPGLVRQRESGGGPAFTGAELLIEAPRVTQHLRSYRGSFDDLLPEAAQRFDEVERLAPGIRPLRVSLTMIWDTLCRTIPGTHVDSSPPPERPTTLWSRELAHVA